MSWRPLLGLWLKPAFRLPLASVITMPLAVVFSGTGALGLATAAPHPEPIEDQLLGKLGVERKRRWDCLELVRLRDGR